MGFLTHLTDSVAVFGMNKPCTPREEVHTEICVKSVKCVKSNKRADGVVKT